MLTNLTPRKVVRIWAGLMLLLVAIAAGEWFFAAATFPRVSLLLGVWILIAVAFFSYRKLIINFQDQRNEVRKGIQQIDPLLYLHQQIDFRHPLPPLRSYAASPDFLALMARLVQERKPQTILELGSGSSTLVNAYLVEKHGTGRVVALDHEAEFADQTRQNLDRHQLSAFAEVIHAPLTRHKVGGADWNWYDTATWLDRIGEIDFLVVDGPPEKIQAHARYPAMPLLLDRLSANATVLVDDCIRREDMESVDRWIEESSGWTKTVFSLEKGAVTLERAP